MGTGINPDDFADPLEVEEVDLALRLAVRAAARIILVVLAMFVLYFVIPVDGFHKSTSLSAWLRLSVVILAFVAVLALQVRIVVSARVPLVRAVEAVVESVVAFLLLFALLYLSLSTTDPSYFSEPLDRVDALYFTTTVFSTVGFGDIVATSSLSRGLVTIQMIAGLGVLALVGKVAFGAARRGRNRRAAAGLDG